MYVTKRNFKKHILVIFDVPDKIELKHIPVILMYVTKQNFKKHIPVIFDVPDKVAHTGNLHVCDKAELHGVFLCFVS
jgi:hypothetical protein